MSRQSHYHHSRYQSLTNQTFWLESAFLRDRIAGIPIDPHNPIPSACKIFHPFPILPVELRVKIWVLARDQSPTSRRVIKIDVVKNGIDGDGTDRRGAPLLVSRALVPALLHVNFESRYVALKKYVLFNGGAHAPAADGSDDPIWQTYINYDKDWVYANTDIKPREIDAVLAANPHLTQSCLLFGMNPKHGGTSVYFSAVIRRMVNLKSFVMMKPSVEGEWKEGPNKLAWAVDREKRSEEHWEAQNLRAVVGMREVRRGQIYFSGVRCRLKRENEKEREMAVAEESRSNRERWEVKNLITEAQRLLYAMEIVEKLTALDRALELTESN